MDGSGNNRYELLFMDDDISDPLDNIVTKNKKQIKTASGSGGPSSKSLNKLNIDIVTRAQTNKKPNQAEKENKPLAINKKELNKKSTGAFAADKTNFKQSTSGFVSRKHNGPNDGQPGQGNQSTNFGQQTREQRNNRRNIRENDFNSNTGIQGEGGTSQPTRQIRERDSRGQPRNRYFENFNRGSKREFDRQSGSDKTGVKAIDKRDGSGAHNWGSVKDTIDEVNKVKPEGNNTDKADESGNEQPEQVPTEEETKELTLDEWKAQKQQRIKPTFNIRKAGEGEDTSQWKKMVVLNNGKKRENESEEELEYDPAMYPQRVGRQQRLLDIQFNFNDGRRGGAGFSGRRGRGPRPSGNLSTNCNDNDRPAGSRGNIERGGKRNFVIIREPQNIILKVNDERQFPTLA